MLIVPSGWRDVDIASCNFQLFKAHVGMVVFLFSLVPASHCRFLRDMNVQITIPTSRRPKTQIISNVVPVLRVENAIFGCRLLTSLDR